MILYMMENYIYQDVAMMIDDGDYLDAFELICYLFLKVGDVDKPGVIIELE